MIDDDWQHMQELTIAFSTAYVIIQLLNDN